MKHFYLFLLLMICFGCQDFKDRNIDSNRTKLEDSIMNTANTGRESKQESIIDKDCLSDFESFFERFSRDSLYQKKMVKYPLKSEYYVGDSYDELTTELIESPKYKFIDFKEDSNAMQNETGKYTIEKKRIHQGMIYTRFGYHNGIHISYEFKFTKICWFLVKITDQST
jgi:hypothetical protein